VLRENLHLLFICIYHVFVNVCTCIHPPCLCFFCIFVGMLSLLVRTVKMIHTVTAIGGQLNGLVSFLAACHSHWLLLYNIMYLFGEINCLLLLSISFLTACFDLLCPSFQTFSADAHACIVTGKDAVMCIACVMAVHVCQWWKYGTAKNAIC